MSVRDLLAFTEQLPKLACDAPADGGRSAGWLMTLRRRPAHKLQPMIDPVLPFEEAPAAPSYMAQGTYFGKVVISH
ncbi:zinc-binding dehydrogenase [Streptomyces sp. NPDC097610]|uniref:zinc-binding dehydrogenase n=1 Tax=Streptomyces sp. NPDC097610 TaxID=3157227 RepID=UPI00332EE041